MGTKKVKLPPTQEFDWGSPIPDIDEVVLIHSRDALYARGQLWLQRKPFLQIIGEVRKEKCPELPELPLETTGLQLYVNKLPFSQYLQIKSFFRWVYEKYRAEAIVQLFLNPTLNGGTWEVRVPLQVVTGSHIDYAQPGPQPDGWYYVGTFHSHGSFDAFHSKEDRKDEDDTYGFHFTFGSQGEIDAMFFMDGWRFFIDAASLIEFQDDFPPEWMNQVTNSKFAPLSEPGWTQVGFNRFRYTGTGGF